MRIDDTACVVGGGIGGLATALALHRKGWDVTVLERGAELRASGGGIGLTPNGLLGLDAIGIGDKVRACSVVQEHGGIRNPRGKWLAKTDLDFVESRFGVGIRALLRADLLSALHSALPAGSVRFQSSVIGVQGGGSAFPAVVTTSSGDSFESDIIVGADGIRSSVRSFVEPTHPGIRSCASRSWRFVVPRSGLDVVAGETWGTGARFSILPISDDMVHCSAILRSSDDSGSATTAAILAAAYGDWHDPIPSLIARSTAAEPYYTCIEELTRPLSKFYFRRMVVVGDAAHAMTPNVGSANLAIEDAIELAHVLGQPGAQRSAALVEYDRLRRRRTTALGRLSRRTGSVAECTSPVAVAIRDTAIRLGGRIPKPLTARSLDRVIGWRPPVCS
ncbi:FAD-dependent oxidoreductase [Antrihabitans spumae]